MAETVKVAGVDDGVEGVVVVAVVMVDSRAMRTIQTARNHQVMVNRPTASRKVRHKVRRKVSRKVNRSKTLVRSSKASNSVGNSSAVSISKAVNNTAISSKATNNKAAINAVNSSKVAINMATSSADSRTSKAIAVRSSNTIAVAINRAPTTKDQKSSMTRTTSSMASRQRSRLQSSARACLIGRATVMVDCVSSLMDSSRLKMIRGCRKKWRSA
jgi:hypothetical protein